MCEGYTSNGEAQGGTLLWSHGHDISLSGSDNLSVPLVYVIHFATTDEGEGQ